MLRKQWTDVLAITETSNQGATAETSKTDLEQRELNNNRINFIQEGQKNAVDHLSNEFV